MAAPALRAGAASQNTTNSHPENWYISALHSCLAARV